jgi:hypothetical protein
MTQGQGPTTEEKLRGIQAALTVSLRLSLANNVARYNYWHADLNSGSGHNQIANCLGSPIAFLNAADAVGRQRYTAIFCDKDLGRITELQARIGANKRAECVNWDNHELLPVLAERIERSGDRPQFAMGSVLIDPNGYFDEKSVPHVELAEFAGRFPRMDLVFNLNIRTYQLGNGHVANGLGKWATKFWPSPKDFPDIFHRPHWLISTIKGKGGDRFCLFIGRTLRAGDHAALGIYRMESEMGQQILKSIDGISHAKETADSVSPLPELPGISPASDVPRGARSRDEERQQTMQFMWEGGDGSSSPGLLPVGPIRSTVEPESDLS